MKIFGLALIGAIISFVLKAFGWRGAPIAAIATMLALLSFFTDSFDKIKGIFDIAREAEGVAEAGEYLLKILGIGYLSGICSDVCRELGEAGIAKGLEIVGRVEIIAIVIPYFEKIIELGIELIG